MNNLSGPDMAASSVLPPYLTPLSQRTLASLLDITDLGGKKPPSAEPF